MKENFYVFLDFDGVLSDFRTIPNIFKIGGFLVNPNDRNAFNKESIEAVNYLIETLSLKYNTKLVLSTSWRRNFNKAKQILINNGLRYDGDIDLTPKLHGKKRAYEIIKYLVDNQHEGSINFVTIDDKRHLPQYFKPENCIKTSMFRALEIPQIINYLDTYHSDVMKDNPPKDFYDFLK